MNRTHLALAFVASVGCSQQGLEDGHGTSNAPTAGSSASGVVAMGGSDASTQGGAPAAAGTPATTGGQATAGSGMVTAGTSAGAATGGAAGSGNSAGSSSMAGGTAGGAGGVGGGLTPATLVPTLDGYMWIGTCSGAGAGLDCKINDDLNQCPNSTATDYAKRGSFRKKVHNVGGTAGTKYTVNFEVRGVAGGKAYTDGKLRTSTFSETMPNDGWYEGGTPTDSKWNTWELHVDPPVPNAPNVYYLNAFSQASGYDGKHETFPISFSASFPVLGGGTITLVVHDSNCLGQQNCGQTVTGQSECTNPRTVSLAGLEPQPMGFSQPYAQADGLHPQWLFIDVKSVSQQ